MGAISVVWMVLRRMLTQWRMEVCLFLGLLAATSVVTAVPLYTTGALQNTFQTEWESKSEAKAPGVYTVSLDAGDDSTYDAKKRLEQYYKDKPIAERDKVYRDFAAKSTEKILTAHTFLQKAVAPTLDIPLKVSAWTASLYSNLELPGPASDPERTIDLEVYTMTGLVDLVKVQDGRLPSDRIEPDGTIEIACPTASADENNLIIGQVYPMESILSNLSPDDGLLVPLKFRLVGTFRQRPDRLSSLAWITNSDVSSGVYMNPGVFLRLLKEKSVRLSEFNQTWVMDHRQVHLANLPSLIARLNLLDREYQRFKGTIATGETPLPIFQDFSAKENSIRLMMLALALPTLLLILYYAALAAGLIIDQRRAEIAMLRSRGASSIQLVAASVLEWTIIGAGCLILGPFLGLVIAQLFGASAGFLNFVDRKALPIALNAETYQYAVAMVLIMIIAVMVPSIKAARHSIISYKQERSRMQVKPFWQRFYLDLLLLGIGIYGYRIMMLQSVAAGQVQAELDRLIDPFLFIIPTLLVLGVGLLLLRLLPLITGLLEKLVNHGRGVALYASLLEVSRNPGRYRPLILLVVLTAATGIYGAAMARSLDQNTHDQVYYAAGADAVLEERWLRLMPTSDPKTTKPLFGAPAMDLDKEHPFEPPYLMHRNMPGVVSTARVQITKDTKVIKGNGISPFITVMAVDPKEFAQTAWFRRDLTDQHPYAYLNMLAKHPQAVLVSKNLLESGNFKLGDSMTLLLHKQKIDFVIVGVVPYWPALYADKAPFAIANLNYVTEQSAIAPYKIWLKLTPSAMLTPGLDYLAKKNISVISVKDARSELALAKRDPQKMGFYGIISVGFCVAVLIMVIGFLLYTFISLQGRMLQFGMLRAIGLSLRQLIQTLFLELIWSVGLGLAAGTLIGELISEIFVPFLRTAASFKEATPPFFIVIAGADIWTIYEVLLPVFFAALAVLSLILARLQIHQAVKLGEEG